MYFFSLSGMALFMNVKFDGALNDQVNFQTFGSSVMLLFRLVTAAGWNDILEPLMNTRDCTVDDPANGVVGDCGSPLVATIYFTLYIIIIFLGKNITWISRRQVRLCLKYEL